MRADHGEVFQSLRGRRVQNVEYDAQVIPDRAHLALEGAREGVFGQFEFEAEAVVSSRHDRYGAILVLVCNRETCILYVYTIL